MECQDINTQFFRRPDKLHIDLWALTALGKYVEGSDIDQAWVKAGLYSPTAVKKYSKENTYIGCWNLIQLLCNV